MKTLRKPLIAAAVLYAGYIVLVLTSIDHLPERIATHFSGTGIPDGWMSRSGYIRIALLFGIFFPLSFPAACLFLRLLPNSAFNLPRRDYWLAPDRRVSTLDDFLRRSLWLSCMSIAFVGGVHYLVLRSNQLSQPRLSTGAVLLIAGCYVAVILVGLILFLRHYGDGAVDRV